VWVIVIHNVLSVHHDLATAAGASAQGRQPGGVLACVLLLLAKNIVVFVDVQHAIIHDNPTALPPRQEAVLSLRQISLAVRCTLSIPPLCF
jgi:hypothetical protein